jgi:hypothetical protein
LPPWRQRRHGAVVADEHEVLVLPGEHGALVPEHRRDEPLHAVGHVGAGRLPLPDGRRVHPAEELHRVAHPGVGQVVEGVDALPPAGRRSVEHAVLDGERHGHDAALAAELGEQRAEPEQVGLPAGGALGADHHAVATAQEPRHGGAVAGAVPGEVHGAADRREHVGDAAQAVGHGADLPVQRDGHVDRVDERAVVASVELAGGAAAVRRERAAEAPRLARGGEECRGVPVRQGHGDGEAGDGEDRAQGEPHEHGHGAERRRQERQPAVVEDERVRVVAPRQAPPLAMLLRARHVQLLAESERDRVMD